MNSTKAATKRSKCRSDGIVNEKKSEKTSGGTRVGPKRSAKRERDPNAPKKPMTAFILFSNDERTKVKNEKPNISFGEIGKELGKRWREANDELRQKYKLLADEDKSRYDSEFKNYNKQ